MSFESHPERTNKHDTEKGVTRRRFLKMAAGAAAVGAVGAHLLREPPDITGSIETKEDPLAFLDVSKDGRICEMENLKGYKFSGLFTKYTGIQGTAPEFAEIDFRYQLAGMWKDKLKKMKGKGNYPAGSLKAVKGIFTSYRPAQVTTMNIVQYQSEIEDSLREVRIPDMRAIRRLAAFKGLSDTQTELLRRFDSVIRPQSLLSFAVTELMPTSGLSAPIGVAMFDFLLRNAGREYVERIPALGDPVLSFGPYQFTNLALSGERGKKQGASVIDTVLPASQLPENVAELRGNDHHKAAYLFAVYNLARLVSKLGPAHSEHIFKYFRELPNGTTLQYIAAAHNRPESAIDAFTAFTNEFKQFNETPKDERASGAPVPNFLKHCDTRKGIGEYCRKTMSNLEVLRARGTSAG